MLHQETAILTLLNGGAVGSPRKIIYAGAFGAEMSCAETSYPPDTSSSEQPASPSMKRAPPRCLLLRSAPAPFMWEACNHSLGVGKQKKIKSQSPCPVASYNFVLCPRPAQGGRLELQQTDGNDTRPSRQDRAAPSGYNAWGDGRVRRATRCGKPSKK